MTAPLKLNAYSVSLVFGTGAVMVNVLVAPSPEAATGMLMDLVLRQGILEQSLSGVAVAPVSLEWLRFAQRAIESGTMEGGSVVSLVPQAAEPPATPNTRMV